MKLAKELGILALIVVVGLAYGSCSARQWPDDGGTRERLIAHAQTGAGVLDLASITSFDWTRLEIFGPYASKKTAAERLGFEWPYRWSAVEGREDLDFLVFVDSNRVAAAFDLPHDLAVVRAADGWISRDAARVINNHGTLVSIEPPFESDLWPGEGIPVIRAQTDTLVLFPQPRAQLQPIARRPVRRGEQIRFDSTRYVTLSPVQFLTEPDTLRGRAYGQVRRVHNEQYYSSGRDTVIATRGWRPLLLQARAEGECFVRVGREVLAARCPEVANMPGTAWWAWTPGPGAAGWFVVSDSTARVTRRGG